jgi:hypothetical protein
MNYLFLLYQNPATFPSDGAAREAQFKAYGDFTDAVKKSGHFVSGDPVIPMPDQTRTVKTSGVKTGPAHNIPEALVGLYVLDCKTIDEAAMIAGKIPAAKDGCVQVVPFMEM